MRQVLSTLEPHIQPNTLVIDCSTIDPATCKWALSLLKQRKAIVLDAPVSGGTPGAQAGTLTFMVGSEGKQQFDSAKLIFESMGKNIVDCGSNGNGQGRL